MFSSLLKSSLVLILIFLSESSQAQETYIQVAFGGGTFYMNRLKDFGDEATKGSEILMENVENFEPYWCYYLKLGNNKKNEVGTNLSFYSTGSRSAYEDYSGYVYFDQIVYGMAIGPYVNFLISQKENNNFYIGFAANFITSYYTVKESTKILKQEYSEDLRAWSIGGEIGINFSYRHEFSRFFIQPETGLMINIANSVLRTRPGNNKISYYSGNDEKSLKVNWSGVRVFLSVGYYLNSRE